MTVTEIVPRKRDREPADRPPLVDVALADELLARAQSEGVELLGPDGLLSQVTKAVLERALADEMTEDLGYEKHDPAGIEPASRVKVSPSTATTLPKRLVRS
jgi:putative transposase